MARDWLFAHEEVTMSATRPTKRCSATANGYELASRESLLPSPGWESVTSDIALEGTRFVVTNAPVGPAGFFRLSRP